MLSDHGFELLRQNVYLNRVLQDAGFQHFDTGTTPGLNALGSDTRAFALEPSRIYLHTQERFPHGAVAQEDRESLLSDLTACFESLTYEGERVIRRVYRREELYRGPETRHGPDLVLSGHAGYNLRASWRAAQTFGVDLFAGKHSQADAFLLARGAGAVDSVPEHPAVADIVEIMDRMRQAHL
jgi:predicted AlkP superfamily phosphohydrolase/phosphomutase